MSDQIVNDLPDILDASQIASALRISRAGAYNLLNSEDFPTLHIGRRKLVMKDDLIQWLKGHTNTTPILIFCTIHWRCCAIAASMPETVM